MSMNYHDNMKLKELSNELFNLLNMQAFEGIDVSLNGLQCGDENANIRKVAFAVDANMQTIEKAVENKADLLFVHHGMFWGKPFAITGYHYDKIKALLDNKLAVFACHLPLDAHLELGNNAQMAKFLNLEDIKLFSLYKGSYVGVKGVFHTPMTASCIIETLGIRKTSRTMVIGKDKKIKNIAIVSGDGAFDMYEALSDNLDALITGEARYSIYNDCEEAGFTMLCLGHYETETFGVKAVMQEVSKMGLETCFIDTKVSL